MDGLLYILILNCFVGYSHQMLPCQDIDTSIEIIQQIENNGRAKKIFRGRYKGEEIVLSYPLYKLLEDDFAHGLEMLSAFQGSGFVTQLIGYCQERDKLKLVTKFYKHGSLERLKEQISNWKIGVDDEWRLRVQLTEDYLSIMEYLHNSPIGTRVMCDSNDLEKTLSQFLITDDFRMVVNDLDALPEITTNGTVKCGTWQLHGDFVAPEQLWPHENRAFSDEEMTGYDEKTDIWKMPNVLVFLLGTSSQASQLKILLFDLFRSCKEYEAVQRPSAKQVKRAFLNALKQFRSRRNEL